MYWDWCLALKYIGALGLLTAVGWMWSNADIVTTHYTDDRAIQALQLEPLTFSAATIPPSGDEVFQLAPAPETGSVPLGALALVEESTTDPKIRGGSSELGGTVRGMAADDVGEVLLTRITDGGQSNLSVVVSSDGTWQASGIRGGRYRVRAYVPSVRASNGSAVLFLPHSQTRRLDLDVTTPPEELLLDLVAGEELRLGSQDVVALTVAQQSVDADGRSILSPVPGVALQATFSAVVSNLSASQVVTDGGGAARFWLQCTTTGRATITVLLGEQNALFTLPPCVEMPSPEPAEAEPTQSGTENADG